MTTEGTRVRRVAIGVDTHKHIHVAVALDHLGTLLGDIAIPVNAAGYERLLEWALDFGQVITLGIEGTGSYGAGLAGHARRQGHTVIEVARPDRRDRRLRGKSDLLDAENAARAVLAGTATATPKSADGAIEMLREIKVAKDTAVKARTAAMITLKSLIVTAPDEVREQLQDLSKMSLITRCLALRPGELETPLSSSKHVLRALARRWRDLNAEIQEHTKILEGLTRRVAPQLVDAFGVGPDSAAEVLIVAGDNPRRIRSEAAWARLCGVAPVPASSGKTGRHRLNRGGHRQANSALYRIVIVRMHHHEQTRAYLARRIQEGRTKKEIIRCLKRFLAREIWALLRPLREESASLVGPA